MIGIKDDDGNRTVLRLVGVREIGHGVAILFQRNPTGGVWSRVAGDTMDIAYLGSRLVSGDARQREKVASALMAVVGITAVDVATSTELSRRTDGRADGGMHVRKAITIRKSPEEVYRFWRSFENLPRFMSHLKSVRDLGNGRSHWQAEGPGGKTVEWDAETTAARPNELIAWRSVEGSDVDNAGQVRFTPAPGGRGMEIHVDLRYKLPGGKLGATLAKLFGKEPGQEVAGDLRRLKQVLEAGEAIVSEATIEGTRFPQHPAQPPEDAKLRPVGRAA
jgi:uncharacterized membrane protein